MRRSRQFRGSQRLIFEVIPGLVVCSWLFFLVTRNTSPPSQSTAYVAKKAPLHPDLLQIRVKKLSSEFKKTINLSETVIYIDTWRSHWCTYYNDREFYFTPRINEMAQRFRKIGVPIVQISLSIDAASPNSPQRILGKRAVSRGNLSVLEKFHARALLYHKDYIPGFQDTCMYKDQERFGRYRDNSLSKTIAVTDEDIFVSNFKESAMSFVGLGAKTVIIMGQHTNMCLMAVFLYCREVGLDLIIVRDLVDSCWIYDLQKKTAPSHTVGNKLVNDYFEKEFGSSMLSYDLIRSLSRSRRQRTEPVYTRFMNRAFMFKHI